MPVEVLPSGRLRDARANLEAVIDRARNEVTAFGRDLDFDAPVWDVTEHSTVRASNARQRNMLYFTTYEGGTSKSMNGRTPLTEPFASFVKALVRQRQEAKSKTPENHGTLIRAARYLHDTLADRGHDPCRFLTIDFQLAANVCKEREAETSRYRIGLFLVEIAHALNRYGISKARIDFRNPFARVSYDHTRIGKEHDMRRAEKLPSPEMLDALAQIANLVDEPSDVLRMRAVELLVCGGWRINELLTLPDDCEIEEEAFENGRPVLGNDGQPVFRYGIRYWPEKGGEPRVKWMPSVMVDLAKRAVRDIRHHSAKARPVARFIEAHPGRAYIPAQFGDGGPDQLFSMEDLGQLFGLARRTSRTQWVRRRKLPVQVIGRAWHVRRADLEAALLTEQPDLSRSPLPLRLSEYLFLVPLNLFHMEKATNPCVVAFLTDGQIRDFLGGRVQGSDRVTSVFERFGFTEADGTPMAMTSHMFRHWLNTLAQQGGMGQHEIARWFGRQDMGQNAIYDHASGTQYAEQVRGMMERGQIRGPIADIHDRLPPVDRESFRESVLATVHTTDIGMCINDWSLAPCPNHGSCADCGDHLVKKGDADQKGRAETLLDENEWVLKQALQEVVEETYGASNHVAHTRSIVTGLRRILGVHSDSTIPDGTLVHVNPATPSRYTDRPLDGGTLG
ncbi:hypothetical protein GBZ26_11355 [Azospirillum formosense]|uniref:Integrase n=1 Tax=Azospirillum formosense TaxID=861533 RepID=A0ABX2KT38_9PROT|nr:hypothetical protein [Azospirillum formosense]MBY3755528.1 hypothetical protein [Azospirillum formosense]NUB19808.1 hypothetical protein [Azospirillum formosense]